MNCEKLKAFSLRSGERQEWPLLFKAALQFLPGAVRQEKEIKDIQIGMKKKKKKPITIYRWHIRYRKPLRLHRKTVRLTNSVKL